MLKISYNFKDKLTSLVQLAGLLAVSTLMPISGMTLGYYIPKIISLLIPWIQLTEKESRSIAVEIAIQNTIPTF